MLEVFKISIIAFMFVALGEPGQIFAWYQRLIDPLPVWLNKPLGGCGMCFGGQVSFWYFLIVHWSNYNIIDHLYFAALTIFLVNIYSLIWNYENP